MEFMFWYISVDFWFQTKHFISLNFITRKLWIIKILISILDL